MAIPKVMGIETEYGITVRNQPDFNPILSSLLLINSYETFRSSRVRWDYEAESPLRDARSFEYMEEKEGTSKEESRLINLILSNGARFYVDHAHPEYSVPDHEVSRIRRFRARVLGVGVVDVEARAVGEDEVDEARLFFRRAFLLFHVLEAARVAQRALGLVVPAHARGPVRLVRVDEQKRGEDGVEIRLVLDRDPVLGLDAHDFRDGHAVPRSLENRNPWPGPGGRTRGARRPPLDRNYRYCPVLTMRSTLRCFSLDSPISGFT